MASCHASVRGPSPGHVWHNGDKTSCANSSRNPELLSLLLFTVQFVCPCSPLACWHNLIPGAKIHSFRSTKRVSGTRWVLECLSRSLGLCSVASMSGATRATGEQNIRCGVFSALSVLLAMTSAQKVLQCRCETSRTTCMRCPMRECSCQVPRARGRFCRWRPWTVPLWL